MLVISQRVHNNMNSVISNSKHTNYIRLLRRWKSNKNEHWSMLNKKTFPKDRALSHFDDFYHNVFGDRWKSMRLALLSPNKFCAVINNYGDAEKTICDLENKGALNMRKLFNLEKEKISTLKQVSEKKSKIEKTYKLEEKLDHLKTIKMEEEIESIYSKHESDIHSLHNSVEKDEYNTSVLNKTNIKSSNLHLYSEEDKKYISLEDSLKLADYDASRILNPSDITASALHEYIPATKLKGLEDWLLESDHYRYYESNNEFPVKIMNETDLPFPESLNIYTYERSNITSFESPRKGSTGVLNYYLLDGGSVLPVLALGLKPGDHVLDMCASPGGKSLMMLQTLYPEKIVCNDVQDSRIRRISNVFNEYFYDFDKQKDRICITRNDARNINDGEYDKILVDVPCTTDRHSVMENDNNLFKQTRMKERLKLPELQAQILSNAMKLVKIGGTIIYSTCTLSPVQNDGVVHMALKNIWQETNIEMIVKDLKFALRPTQCIYKIDYKVGLKYGHLIVPFLPCNFGPMYFCKLVRLK